MSRPSDHSRDMPPTWLTDDIAEAVMRGDDLDGPLASVAAFGREVQAFADRPPPAPSRALAAMFAEGASLDTDESPGKPAASTTRRPLVRRVAARIAVGTAAITLGVAGAAAAGVLPEGARSALRDAVDVITPDDTEPAPPPHDPDTEAELTPPPSSTDPGRQQPDSSPASDSGRRDKDSEPDPSPDERDPDREPGGRNGDRGPQPEPDPGARGSDEEHGPGGGGGRPEADRDRDRDAGGKKP